jgi:hypothetical protein
MYCYSHVSIDVKHWAGRAGTLTVGEYLYYKFNKIHCIERFHIGQYTEPLKILFLGGELGLFTPCDIY